jgi:hypothetical protein
MTDAQIESTINQVVRDGQRDRHGQMRRVQSEPEHLDIDSPRSA